MTFDDSKSLPKGIIRSKSADNPPSPRVPSGCPLPPSRGERGISDEASHTVPVPKKRDSRSSVPLSPRDGGRGHPEGTRGEGGNEGRITAIEEQARHKDRVNVYVDGKFAIGLFADVAVSLALKVGQSVTAERLTELADAENRRKAREDAYRLLSFRARTEKEILDRLKRREYDEEVIADTVRYLHEQHLLDDTDFATRFAASRSRTHGDRAITMELRQKGVSADTIKEILTENADEDGERDTVRTLAVKRVGERPVDTSPQAKQKLWAFLARRGFGSDVIRSVLSELYGKMPEDE